MKIYRLTQSENTGYDTYDTVIVVAATEEKARQITPNNMGFSNLWSSWASDPENVTAELIGTTKLFKAGTVLCTSFNAG
jgi:hypothetical protein